MSVHRPSVGPCASSQGSLRFPAIGDDVLNCGTISGTVNAAQDRGLVVDARCIPKGDGSHSTAECRTERGWHSHGTVRTGLGLMRPKSQSAALAL